MAASSEIEGQNRLVRLLAQNLLTGQNTRLVGGMKTCCGKTIPALKLMVFLGAFLVMVPGLSSGQPQPTAECIGTDLRDGTYLSKGQVGVIEFKGVKYRCVGCGDCTPLQTQPSAGKSSTGGEIPMGLPTTEGQAMVTVMGWLLQGIMSGGSSADEQQQQALLQQQQAEEKLEAEMLQRERAAQASEARDLWESQDAARSRELGSLFGPPTDKTGGMSPLLQKQAALQLRVAATPGSSGSDESLRQRAGEGFDEAGKSLAAVPVVPELEGTLDRGLVMTKIKESRTWVDKLDRELETTRKKQGKAQQALEQARRELTAKQAKPGPEAQQDDAALLAALEAEEQNIKTLSREVEESSAQLKVLEDLHHKAVQGLEMWSVKLEAAQ